MGVRRGRASRGLGGVSGSGGAMRLGSPWGWGCPGAGGGGLWDWGFHGVGGGAPGGGVVLKVEGSLGMGGSMGTWRSLGFGGVHLVWDWRVRGAGGTLRLGGPWGRGHPWDSGVPGSEGVFTHPPPYVQDLGNAATPPGATQPSVPQFPLRRCTRRTAEPPRDPSPPTGGGNPRWGRPRETAAPLLMGRIRAAGTARPRYAAEGPLLW